MPPMDTDRIPSGSTTDHEPTDKPDVWDVSVDLWTAEEGRSDLTLEGQVRDDGSAVILRIERIHTL